MDKVAQDEKIRSRIAVYRKSAAAARSVAEQTALPENRDGCLRTAEGFEKLADTLEDALKRSLARGGGHRISSRETN
jgi:hypothetical protein